MLKILPHFPHIPFAESRSLFRNLLIALVTIVLGVLVGYLIVSDAWHIAAVLIFSVPALLILQRHPFLGVLIWLVATPFLMHTNTSTLRQVYWVIHRALPLLTLALIVVPALLGLNRKKLPRLGIPEGAMIGYVIASILSIVLLNQNPVATFYLYYDRVISPMCLYFVVRFSQPDDKLLSWLVYLALFITLSQTIIGILSWFVPDVLPRDWRFDISSRVKGSLVNANIFTTTQVFAGLLVFYEAINSRPGLKRSLFLMAFLLSLYSIFITLSRASWLAGLLVLLLLAYLYPKFLLKLTVRLIPVLLIVAVVAGPVLADQIQWANRRLYSEEAERSAVTRLPVFFAAIRMFQEKPLFGWGYGNFDRYDSQFLQRVGNVAYFDEDKASHNLYLTIVSEQGIAGLVLYLLPAIWWLVQTRKHYSKLSMNGYRSKRLLILLWAVLLSHVVVNNISNMRVVFGLGMWWLTLGLIANLIQSNLGISSKSEAKSYVISRAASPKFSLK